MFGNKAREKDTTMDPDTNVDEQWFLVRRGWKRESSARLSELRTALRDWTGVRPKGRPPTDSEVRAWRKAACLPVQSVEVPAFARSYDK